MYIIYLKKKIIPQEFLLREMIQATAPPKQNTIFNPPRHKTYSSILAVSHKMMYCNKISTGKDWIIY